MPIVYIPEQDIYDPLNNEPYKSFNEKIENMEEKLRYDSVKFEFSDKNSYYFVNDIKSNEGCCYCLSLTFLFSHIQNRPKDILIHHTIEYGYDEKFQDAQEHIIDSLMKRKEYIYLPKVKVLEMDFALSVDHLKLVFDVITDKENLKETANQIISNDMLLLSNIDMIGNDN